MAERLQMSWKTLLKNAEIARYDFSFSHSVFKRFVLKTSKIKDSFGKGLNVEKDKLLVTGHFSFSHSGFEILVQQTCKNQDLFGKGIS